MMPGVVNSPYHWYAELTTPHINDMQSRQLSVSMIQGVDVFFTPNLIRKKIRSRFSVSMICRVSNSLYRWYAESATLRISHRWSRQLSVSTTRRVDFRKPISPSIQIRITKNFMSSVRELCRTGIYKKIKKKVALVSSFKEWALSTLCLAQTPTKWFSNYLPY